jgi:diacylglycerol kinase (ATP)
VPKKTHEPAKGQQGVGRSFHHAYDGIVSAVRTQRNMRFHLFAAVGVLVAGLLLGVSGLELAVLVLTIVVVFVVEMLNTAMEFVVDLVTDEYHPLAKLAKDVSAGAVLVSSVGAVLVGYLVLADDLGPLFAGALGGIRRGPVLLTLAALGLVVLITVLGKALIRPSTSFFRGTPSGHAAVAFAGWVAASFLSAGGRHAGLVSLLSLLAALLVCQSRIEGGIQSPYQVMSGAALGSLATVAIFQLS